MTEPFPQFDGESLVPTLSKRRELNDGRGRAGNAAVDARCGRIGRAGGIVGPAAGTEARRQSGVVVEGPGEVEAAEVHETDGDGKIIRQLLIETRCRLVCEGGFE